MIRIISQRMPNLSKRCVQIVDAAVMFLSCFLHINSWATHREQGQKKKRGEFAHACALHVLHVSFYGIAIYQIANLVWYKRLDWENIALKTE